MIADGTRIDNPIIENIDSGSGRRYITRNYEYHELVKLI